jgi:predicted lysophospholipase L1 biosynthesis ABC-type transport system permease subunit
MFFAGVALLLAAIGLYGVLNYSMLQRRREISIRLAVGAPRAVIAKMVTAAVFVVVITGVVIGAAMRLAAARYIEDFLPREVVGRCNACDTLWSRGHGLPVGNHIECMIMVRMREPQT